MKVTVVGDVLLDEDVEGEITRLCPDAPVPVLEVARRRSRPGGAGLVATMLQRDGHEVELVTTLSHDAGARTLKAHLAQVRLVYSDSGVPTPVKTRMRTASQAVCRIDEGCEEVTSSPPVTEAMLTAVQQATVIVVADYGRGLTRHPRLREALQARAADVPLVWDPHPKGADPVPASWVVTPNLAEAAAVAGCAPEPAEAAQAALTLRQRYGCANVLVTLGAAGACLASADGVTAKIDTPVVVHGDPCGAGDRLAASLALQLGEQATALTAARTAVAAAAEYLRAGGVASLDTTLEVMRPLVVDESDDPVALARRVREAGGTVVAAGGCFDLLHAGHVRTLEAARALGDVLIVCINSDDSVRRLKGRERPIIAQHDRTEMLRALACVDAVLVFDEDGPERALTALKPHYWVKGGDYTAEALPETRLLEKWGGNTVVLPFHLGRSTTQLAAALARVG